MDDAVSRVAATMLAAGSQPIIGYQIISNLHGPIWSGSTLQDARAFAQQQGIPIGSQSSGAGHFIMPIRAPGAPGG